MRERGLKLVLFDCIKLNFWSLPMRERGLKQVFLGLALVILLVAPHAGAWIETFWMDWYWLAC